MKRIVVSGYYGAKNAGDEAMLAAMLEVLGDLDPELHITVISADPEDTERRHGVHAVGALDAGKIFSAVRRADLLISGNRHPNHVHIGVGVFDHLVQAFTQQRAGTVQAGGVHYDHLRILAVYDAPDGVAGGFRLVGRDGDLLPDQRVDQRRLAAA